MNIPSSIRYHDSAASSAAKARGIVPILETTPPFDVATALKCINSFQVRVNVEALEAFDDESKAKPLIAAARILQSTAQHLRRDRKNSSADSSVELDELSFYAALAFAMHGNFPSAKTALSEVSPEFFERSVVFCMVRSICSPSSKLPPRGKKSYPYPVRFFSFYWHYALRHNSKITRDMAFARAMECFTEEVLKGSLADGALLLAGRMAAHQAKRLATANLFDVPEIPIEFTLRFLRARITLMPSQHILLCKERIAGHRRNILLTLPTSTGKTFLAEACIASDLLMHGGLCVYVAPYIAIGAQVKQSLEKHLPRGSTSIIPMFGGFRSEKKLEYHFAERTVIVATPERFDGWLRAGTGVERLCTVVFDEVHILENGARGALVEGLVSRLRLLQQNNTRLRLIGLSAVLTEPQLVCQWFGVQDIDLHKIGWRPTARRLAICRSNGDMYWIHGNDVLRPDDKLPTSHISQPVKVNLPGDIKYAAFPKPNEKNAAINVASIANDLLERIGSLGLIVCPRKIDTRLLAKELVKNRKYVENNELSKIADSIQERYPYLGFLVECLRYGVAYHNASLPFRVRFDIEELTRKGSLSVVCATTTLAEGADLPFRWTIVAHWLSSMQGDGTVMKSMTFRNIAGRCGRASAFSEGDTVLFENLMGTHKMPKDEHRLEKVMFSSSPLISTLGVQWHKVPEYEKKQLEATFSSQLLACIGEHPKIEDIISEFTRASYAGQTASGRDTVDRIFSETVDNILDSEQIGGAMAVRNSPIRLTKLGKTANLTGFSPATCRLMVGFLLRKDIPSSNATLYSELLREFNDISEQSNEKLRKIFSSPNHNFVVKAENLEQMLSDLLSDMDFYEAFERLRNKKSKAQPENVETMFEDFVSFVNDVVGNFLPWLLRGLEKLCVFGSTEAQGINWSDMSRDVEAILSAWDGSSL